MGISLNSNFCPFASGCLAALICSGLWIWDYFHGTSIHSKHQTALAIWEWSFEADTMFIRTTWQPCGLQVPVRDTIIAWSVWRSNLYRDGEVRIYIQFFVYKTQLSIGWHSTTASDVFGVVAPSRRSEFLRIDTVVVCGLVTVPL